MSAVWAPLSSRERKERTSESQLQTNAAVGAGWGAPIVTSCGSSLDTTSNIIPHPKTAVRATFSDLDVKSLSDMYMYGGSPCAGPRQTTCVVNFTTLHIGPDQPDPRPNPVALIPILWGLEVGTRSPHEVGRDSPRIHSSLMNLTCKYVHI